MASLPETVTLRVEVDGIDDVIAAIENSHIDLTEPCERLIAMGWTPTMAETFVGEIAVKIARHIIRVVPAGRDATP